MLSVSTQLDDLETTTYQVRLEQKLHQIGIRQFTHVNNVPVRFHHNDSFEYVLKVCKEFGVNTNLRFCLDQDQDIELLGEEIDSKVDETIENCKILIIGAGGIGCELVKVLVTSGFKNIEITDMDTIALSNLNRQLLFTESDIGMYKSSVVEAVVRNSTPDVSIASHQLKVQHPYFSLEKIKSFDVVIGALDNNSARRYISKLCRVCGVLYIDGGSGGYRGQVVVINPRNDSKVGCLGCQGVKKEKQALTVSCSIRNRPENFFHCLIWAKASFESQFATSTKLEYHEDEKFVEESARIMSFQLYEELFVEDIRTMIETAKESADPRNDIEPLELSCLVDEDVFDDRVGFNPFSVWNASTAAAMFLWSACDLYLRQLEEGCLEFEKEDDLIMKYITSAAVLRATIFKKSPESFIASQIRLGNIAPALGTTNAVIAGVQVNNLIQYLKDPEGFRSIEIWFNENRSLSVTNVSQRDPDCDLCSSPNLFVRINAFETSVSEFVEFLEDNLMLNKVNLMLGESMIVEDGIPEIDVEQFNKSVAEVILEKSQYITLLVGEYMIEVYIYHSEDELMGDLDISADVYELIMTNLDEESLSEDNEEFSVVVKTNSGESFEASMDPDDTFEKLINDIQNRYMNEGNQRVSLVANGEDLLPADTPNDMLLPNGVVIDAFLS